MLHHTAKAGRLLSKLAADSRASRSPLLSQPSRIQKRFMTDHYATLGVSPTANASEIKKAFFEKAKKVHPDVNKGDPQAQKKFVDLSAAYEVLKNKDKRARYDQERQFGGGGFGNFGGQTHYQQSHHQSGPQYHHQQQQYQQAYNPYRGGSGAYTGGESSNPYYQTHSRAQNGDDFMKWYRSQFGDAFREFDEFNRGQTTIIEERMPDGSVRIRILKRGGPGGFGTNGSSGHGFGASGAGNGGQTEGTNPFGAPFGRGTRSQQQSGQSQQQKYQPTQEDVMSALFGRGAAGQFFGSLFRDGFRNSGRSDGFHASGSNDGRHNGIPFGSTSLDYPALRISELSGSSSDEISFSLSNSAHIGVLSHRVLSGNQGDVLTCSRDSYIIAKARAYNKDGKDRIIIENGESKRVATIESIPTMPSSSPTNVPTFLRQIKNALSLHFKILDESDRDCGHLSVSPFRRTIQFFDTQGNQIAVCERKDIEQQDIRRPTLDDWELLINDDRLLDASVFVFSSAFSTLAERKSTNPISGATVMLKAIANKFRL